MTDSAIKYVGVDSCTGGWVAVGLGAGGESCVKVFGRGKFPSLLEHFGGACVVLVDMPIGLPEGVPTYRCCDNEARKRLKGHRQSSVFTVPSRDFVTEFVNAEKCGQPWKYDCANRWIKCKCPNAKSISQQAFHIVKKIVEVDNALQFRNPNASPEVREAHPEICFWALNKTLVGKKKPMRHSKKDGWGFLERFRLVKRLVPDTDIDGVFEKVRREYSNSKVGADDILDALALAITAKLGWQNGFRRLPEDLPHDRKKPKPPEMVYYVIPNEK